MTHQIVLLPGDGVGPEVTEEAHRVVEKALRPSGREIGFVEALVGGAAIDATGNPLPGETVELCRRADAALLGAVGGPKWSDPETRVRPEQALARIVHQES